MTTIHTRKEQYIKEDNSTHKKETLHKRGWKVHTRNEIICRQTITV